MSYPNEQNRHWKNFEFEAPFDIHPTHPAIELKTGTVRNVYRRGLTINTPTFKEYRNFKRNLHDSEMGVGLTGGPAKIEIDFDSADSEVRSAEDETEELEGCASLTTISEGVPIDPKPDSEAAPTSTTTSLSKLELKMYKKHINNTS